jgi:hypothetical protein
MIKTVRYEALDWLSIFAQSNVCSDEPCPTLAVFRNG